MFRSGSLGLFRKGKTSIIAIFHRSDLVICSRSREGKTPSYSQINRVCTVMFHVSGEGGLEFSL